METLPVEMLELIVRQLTTEDLAHCSAVCRVWREVFNQDWIWEPLCDAELEEPLRTTPCVAVCAFVSPDGENSTLYRNCQWKLAYMREKHLQKNWERIATEDGKEHSNLLKFENENIVEICFFTDNSVVVWYRDKIEIVNVGVIPAVCEAITNTLVNLEEPVQCSVVGSTMLLVEKECSVDVYNVDMAKKLIRLNHCIILFQDVSVDIDQVYKRCVKEHFYLLAYDYSSVLQVFDLQTGEKLKEDKFPVNVAQHERCFLHCMQCSSTSNFAALIFEIFSVYGLSLFCYIYHINHLTFLPEIVIELVKSPSIICFWGIEFALHHHWLAYHDGESLTVHNFHTNEVLLSYVGEGLAEIYVCNDRLMFTEHTNQGKTWQIKSYSPLQKTLTTICESPFIRIAKVVNNKVLAVRDRNILYLWKFSGQIIWKCDIFSSHMFRINQFGTRMLFQRRFGKAYYLKCLW